MRLTRLLPGFAFTGSLLAACSGPADSSTSNSAASTSAATCSDGQQADAYEKMLTQPIVPPRMFAGLDLAGGDDWRGLTLDAAEKVSCASHVIGEDGNDATATFEESGWGLAPDYQVDVEYSKTTNLIDFYQLNGGYKGTLDFASRPTSLEDPTQPNPFGKHTYSIGVGRDVQRDGQPWALDWNAIDPQATEMFDALMYTFAPELPSTQKSCVDEGLCLAAPTGGNTAVFGARPLGVYLHVNDITTAASTPDYIYGFAWKTLPFSGATLMLKLDEEGPVATATGIGDKPGLQCVTRLGIPYQTFKDNCVDVLTDPKKDALLDEKLLGQSTRAVTTSGSAVTGTWELSATGFRPGFTSARFDETTPASTSTVTELVLDNRTGKILNEYASDGVTFTLAATTAIYGEYARTVQDFLHANMAAGVTQYPLGDPHCLIPSGSDATKWAPAAGCTGMEQLVVPTATNGFSIGSVLHPGGSEESAQFCADQTPGNFTHCGESICDANGNNCVPDTLGAQGTAWQASRDHVVAVLGGGDATKVPAGAADVNTYLRFWMKALVKYLRAAPQVPIDLSIASFDTFTPADGDITVGAPDNGVVKVTYLDKLELQLDATSLGVTKITFR